MKTLAGRNVKFTIASQYAGEQGHLGGGDSRQHGSFDTFDQAFEALLELTENHGLDYRYASIIAELSPETE